MGVKHRLFGFFNTLLLLAFAMFYFVESANAFDTSLAKANLFFSKDDQLVLAIVPRNEFRLIYNNVLYKQTGLYYLKDHRVIWQKAGLLEVEYLSDDGRSIVNSEYSDGAFVYHFYRDGDEIGKFELINPSQDFGRYDSARNILLLKNIMDVVYAIDVTAGELISIGYPKVEPNYAALVTTKEATFRVNEFRICKQMVKTKDLDPFLPHFDMSATLFGFEKPRGIVAKIKSYFFSNPYYIQEFFATPLLSFPFEKIDYIKMNVPWELAVTDRKGESYNISMYGDILFCAFGEKDNWSPVYASWKNLRSVSNIHVIETNEARGTAFLEQFNRIKYNINWVHKPVQDDKYF